METKRLILAVVLSSAVLLVFNYFTPKKPAVSGPVAGASGVVAPSPAAVAPAPVSRGSEVAGGAPGRIAVMENDRIRVELTTRGGAIVRGSLKEYTDKAGQGGAPVQVLGGDAVVDVLGDVRLVSGVLGFETGFQEMEVGPNRVVYAWDSPTGVRVEKTFTLEPGRYDLTQAVMVRNLGTAPLKDRIGVLMVQDFGKIEDKVNFIGPTFLNGGELEQMKLGDFKKEAKNATGDVAWAAMLQTYFLAGVVPVEKGHDAVRVDRHRGQEKVAEVEINSKPFEIAPGGEKGFVYRIYVGPKLAETVKPVGSELERVIDYGWFSVIARPLLAFLKMLYGVTGNYGLAIIVLTTVVKGVFWPLSAKSFQSMQRMKDLQPKMQKLKERYAKDRERLNMEVMQLYKTHKVNPLGGCLPMLVQIPVFFALYRVLGSAMELRHAPFIFWITDLSVKDPFYVTPLIMGVTMFLQQKMTPATGMDEMQVKMMQYGMPLVFTFMFLNFASGLVLYWLVNNVLSIAQQALMMRSAKTEAV